ncbi:RNA 2',3'-cyclic phosphodiesterase [Streptomyces sp. NPDC091279]|uniref:RNA 2',3'-cyclic phosphodiesterase n=1 Tax=unclassified Streptomyces TaxID=2593676 RepID=UPI00380E1F67
MRLFAAVLPPADVSSELAPVVDQLRRRPDADRLRWTGRPGWHYTLAFYGEVDDDVVPELTRRLARLARQTEPFELAVRGGGQFGNGRALWAGAAGDVAALRRLAQGSETAAREVGVARVDAEHRLYRPHLTLARGGADVDIAPYLAALDDFTGRTWTVPELALVRSNSLDPGALDGPGDRPRYEAVAREPLGGAG